jgi:hypothetical protein
MVDVTHIRPFYFDPNYVTPLNIAAKDTDEYVVEKILAHDFSDFNDKRWLVKWASTEASNETWETYETLKDVEVFQQYCASLQLDPFPPTAPPRFSASAPSMLRKASGMFTLPVPPNVSTDIGTTTTPTISKKRGRPKKHKV